MGVGVAVGAGVAAGVGVGVAAGAGVAAGVGVGVAAGAAVGVGVGVGVGVAAGVGVGVGVAAGAAVGVGVRPGYRWYRWLPNVPFDDATSRSPERAATLVAAKGTASAAIAMIATALVSQP